MPDSNSKIPLISSGVKPVISIPFCNESNKQKRKDDVSDLVNIHIQLDIQIFISQHAGNGFKCLILHNCIKVV